MRRLVLVSLAVLALATCDEMVTDPEEVPPLPPPENAFTPDRERVVGLPALHPSQRSDHPSGDSIKVREAEREAARVMAMHERGGTGAGQIVGTIESGADLTHPDLREQFAHMCAMGDCNDGRPNRDDASPRLDTDGHGAIVNGTIAAAKNGTGVYGVAYGARIASYGNSAHTLHPWGNDCLVDDECPAGLRDKRHQWGSLFDQEIARGIDWMRSLDVRVTNFSWGRTYEWSPEKETRYDLTTAAVRAIMPKTLPAFEAYVAADGVAVWAAGNGDSLHPAVEGMLPRYFPDLQPGWLTVVGLGTDGRISFFSHYCGAAAAWCLAAPGEVVTTQQGGQWGSAGGTSIAAPYAAAGLAALKSRFPDRTYQELRNHMFATADKSPPYDQEWIYGQGRLDLDAASRSIASNHAVDPQGQPVPESTRQKTFSWPRSP